MDIQQKLEELFQMKRMGHVPGPLDPHNGLRGLYDMIQQRFKGNVVMAEIGSFQGASTMLFSMFAEKVYSIDCYDYPVPPTGRIPSHDQLFVDAEKIFLERTSNIPNIIKIKKTSVEASRDFEDASLDLVYIDAEHDYNSVNTDVSLWKHKVKNGGILSGHDWTLPHIFTILSEQNLLNDLEVYSDSSWSVIIER
jgi:predicted O-methyltransferase YrrM